METHHVKGDKPIKQTRAFRTGALTWAMVVGMAFAANSAFAGTPGFEKCPGIVKAGMNDCGTGKHACAGPAKTDRDPVGDHPRGFFRRTVTRRTRGTTEATAC